MDMCFGVFGERAKGAAKTSLYKEKKRMSGDDES